MKVRFPASADQLKVVNDDQIKTMLTFQLTAFGEHLGYFDIGAVIHKQLAGHQFIRRFVQLAEFIIQNSTASQLIGFHCGLGTQNTLHQCLRRHLQ